MAATYDELLKEIEIYGERDDFGTLIPNFVSYAETEMYNNHKEPLLIRDMERIETNTTSTGKYIDLPVNYESSRAVRLELEYGELRYQAPEQMTRYQYTGQPQFFTIIGNQIELDRVPDNDYTIEIQCYIRPDNLSEANQTNSVLQKYPAIYLYGSLVQFFIKAQDDQQALKYDNLFMNAIKGANKSQKKGRHGPAPSMNIDGGMIV